MSSPQDNERLLYAAKLLLSFAGGEMQRTNLIKSLFYLDLFWLQDTGKTFTGAEYVALPQGPVVDGYLERLIRPLLAGDDVVEESFQWAPNATSKILHLQKELPAPDDEHLELVARRIAGSIAGRRAVDISELTHENIAWKTAFKKGSGTPINMVLALDQVTAKDPWLDAEMTEEERQSVDLALGQQTHPL